MTETAETKPVQRAVRIPLKVTNAYTGEEVVPGHLVAVMAEQLDAYEDILYELANFTAMVASTAEAGWRENERNSLGPDANALWERITALASDVVEGVTPDV